MKLLIIGATGGTGMQLVEQALAAGHEVTALARNPVRLRLHHERLRVVQGDVLDSASLVAALEGQEAVLSSLGTRNLLAPGRIFSEGTRNLLAAMADRGVRRLVCITGVGAGDSRGHGGWLYDKLVRPFVLRRIYDDKDRQEAIIRASGCDWIIVRPGFLTNRPATGRFRVLTDLAGVVAGPISRPDVAAFMLAQLQSDRYVHQTPLLTY